MGDTPEGKKPSLDRRGFVKSTLLCGGAVLLTGIPLTSFFLAPAMKKGTGKWVDFGPAEDLNPGKTDMLTYEFMVKDGWKVLPQRGPGLQCHLERGKADFSVPLPLGKV